MAAVYAQIARVRVTSAAHPSEAGYVRSMRMQMDHIAEQISKVASNVKNATPEAIIYGLQPIFELSQELVPVDTGRLKRSGYLEKQTTRSGNVRVAIGYGRHGVPHYAAYVHEMLHIPHAKGKQAKFLEDAVNQRIHVFKYRLKEHMMKRSGLSASKAGRV